MRATPWIIACSMYVYKFVLSIGPDEFCREYGELAVQDFGECCREAYRQGGIGRVVALWYPMFCEALTGMIEEQHSVRALVLWPLLTALILMCFPFYWFCGISPVFREVFEHIFMSSRERLPGHAALFLMVALLIVWAFPFVGKRPGIYSILTLLAVLLEETLHKFHLPTMENGLDLLFDLLGIVLAYICVWLWCNVRMARVRSREIKGL